VVDIVLPLVQAQSRFFVKSSPRGRIFKRGGPPSGPADERMREFAITLALHGSPTRRRRQAKASKVCMTVTNTLGQIAVSTLSARADGVAAG
jgi:hypothetical protein